MTLRFHWRLLQGGDSLPATNLRNDRLSVKRVADEAAIPDMVAQTEFCRAAEASGVESLLVDINYGKPDPMLLSLALTQHTDRIKLMVAFRPGLMSPTLFVQQVNTFSSLAAGRISLNMVAGHSPDEQRGYGDHCSHDERYARMDEFLEICHAFWRGEREIDFAGKFFQIEGGRLNTPFVGGRHPDIFLGGNSSQARDIAIKHATCWMRFADRPGQLEKDIRPAIESGTAVGLRMSLIVRSTRQAAIEAARELLEGHGAPKRMSDERRFVRGVDAVSMKRTFELAEDEWLTPYLWTGAVRVLGAPAMIMLGTPDEVAEGIREFQQAGISHFIFSGWPKLDEMIRFGQQVLPLFKQEETTCEFV